MSVRICSRRFVATPASGISARNFVSTSVQLMPRGPDPYGQRFEGKERVREALLGRLKGIPDVHYGEVEHRASGNCGMSKWLLTGTRSDGTDHVPADSTYPVFQ